MGWTTTIARISYVIGPLLTGFVISLFPTMEWFWVVGSVVILIPIAIIFFLNPSETKTQELEDIETARV
jgi:MFS family permease